MNSYLAFLILFIVALLQTTVMPHIRILGVHPDLMLLVVTSWSILRGAEEGMLWALIGGIPLDLFSDARLGTHTLGLLVVGFLSGLGEKTIFRSDILMPMIVIPLATLGYELIAMAGLYLTGWPAMWRDHLIHIVLPCTLVNTLCMPAVYLLLRALHRHTFREEVSL